MVYATSILHTGNPITCFTKPQQKETQCLVTEFLNIAIIVAKFVTFIWLNETNFNCLTKGFWNVKTYL